MTECGRRNEMVFGEQSDDVRGRQQRAFADRYYAKLKYPPPPPTKIQGGQALFALQLQFICIGNCFRRLRYSVGS